MTISDAALRAALLERVRIASPPAHLGDPPPVVARRVAATPLLPAAFPFRPLVAAAVGLAIVVVIGAGLFAGGRFDRPSLSTPPVASEAARSDSPAPPTPAPATRQPSASSIVSGCEARGFDARRCAAIVAAARRLAGNPSDVVSVAVREPTPDQVSLGSAALADVDLVTADGGILQVQIRCFAIVLPDSSDRLCSADPQIRISGGVSTDVPCGPTPGDENHPCATLPPTPRPAVIAASTPLVVPAVDVVLDHAGHYDVFVGAASLPDGLLSERSGEIADPRPTTFWIDRGISIVVRPGKPCTGDACPAIESIYHEPFRGPQPVNVYLVFDVVELTVPGTVLEIRDLVVR